MLPLANRTQTRALAGIDPDSAPLAGGAKCSRRTAPCQRQSQLSLAICALRRIHGVMIEKAANMRAQVPHLIFQVLFNVTAKGI